MAKNIKELFAEEKRDPASIEFWLKSQGFKPEYIHQALAEHAQKIANGEKFGYVDGLSVLSNSIRKRVSEITKLNESFDVASFGEFSAQEKISFYRKIVDKLKGWF